ncbi:MAG TPA: winged helix-turn-helix domain-containing protein [Terriglobales bacterium]|jgi:cholera toxin transcriptional activator|nr:winged helix-turn-helix domain-containing protein [Terriglobales bacterium]
MPQPEEQAGPQISKPAIVRFAVYEANLRTGELRKHGNRMRLQEQPFQVLALLLEKPGELVTREELRQKLWPADTFVDFDHSLNTAINKLRETLGDSSSAPRFIETLPRRGYRFIAPVTVEDRTTTAEQVSNNGLLQSAQPVSPQKISTEKSEDAQLTTSVNAIGANTEAASVSGQDAIHDLPRPHRNVPRFLFLLIQVMYLCFYIPALAGVHLIDDIVNALFRRGGESAALVVIVTASLGIALRLYWFSAVAFDFRGIERQFSRLFPFLFVLDELWALSPFLLWQRMGIGLVLASTAALVWVPFSQRTLLRMAYAGMNLNRGGTEN